MIDGSRPYAAGDRAYQLIERDADVVTCGGVALGADGFYARQGYVVERVTADGYNPGLDRRDMILRF